MLTFGPTCSRLLKWKTMWSKMQHQREKVAMAGPSSSPHCSLWPTNLRSSYARDDASSLSGRGFDMLGFWLWGGVLTDSNHASWSSETAHFGHFWENLPSIEWIRMTWRHEDMKRISDLALFALNAAQTAVHASAAPATLLRHQPAHGCSPGFCMSQVACHWFLLIQRYWYVLIYLRCFVTFCGVRVNACPNVSRFTIPWNLQRAPDRRTTSNKPH